MGLNFKIVETNLGSVVFINTILNSFTLQALRFVAL